MSDDTGRVTTQRDDHVFVMTVDRSAKMNGFTPEMFDALADANPDAALWWREKAPHLVKPRRRLIFPASVCDKLED